MSMQIWAELLSVCVLVLIFSRSEIVLNAVVILMHDMKSFCGIIFFLFSFW